MSSQSSTPNITVRFVGNRPMDWLPEQTSTPSLDEPQAQPTNDPESEETRELDQASKLPEREYLVTEAELYKRCVDRIEEYVQERFVFPVEKAEAELLRAFATDPHVAQFERLRTEARRLLSQTKTMEITDFELDWCIRGVVDWTWEIYRLWLGKGPDSGQFDGASDDLEPSKSAGTKKRRHTDETERKPSTLPTALNGERETREHKASQTSKNQAVAVDGPDLLPEQSDVTMWYKGCILTGSGIVEKAHIIPSYLTNNLKDLQDLWLKFMDFRPKGVQHTWRPPPAATNHENILPLSPYARSLWDANEFGLRPISSGTSERMYVQMYWMPPVRAQRSGRKPRISSRPRFILDGRRRQMEGTGRHSYPRIQTGDVYELVTDDPVQKPLPNIDILILRYTLLRVLETFREYVTKAGLNKELKAELAAFQAEIADLEAESAIQSSWELPPELEEKEPKVPQEPRYEGRCVMDKLWDGHPPHLKPLSSTAPEAARLSCIDKHALEKAQDRWKITSDEADKWRAAYVTWETEKRLKEVLDISRTLQGLMGRD